MMRASWWCASLESWAVVYTAAAWLAVAPALVRGGAGASAGDNPIRPVVRVVTARKMELHRSLDFMGVFLPRRVVRLTSLNSGMIARLRVRTGMVVGKGAVLVEVENPSVTSAWRQAEADVQKAALELRRMRMFAERQARLSLLEIERKKAKAAYVLKRLELQILNKKGLVQKGMLPKQEYYLLEAEYRAQKVEYDYVLEEWKLEKARLDARIWRDEVRRCESALEAAKARYEEARWRKDELVLKAPFRALVLQRKKSEGEFLRAGEEVLVLASIDDVVVRGKVGEDVARAVRKGMPVGLTIDGESMPARVETVLPALDTPYGYEVVVVPSKRVDSSQDCLNRGVLCSVTVATYRGTGVPSKAVFERNGKFVVCVLRSDGRVEIVPVEKVYSSADTVIVEGLAPGVSVVVEGQYALDDGMRVLVEGDGGAR